MTIEEKQQDIIAEFADIEDWLDRYAMIIDLGNQLPPIPDSLKTPDRLIEGCQSRVWLDSTLDDSGHVHFTADSDAIIVKGIISMLISVLDGHTPREILDADLHFIDDIGLGRAPLAHTRQRPAGHGQADAPLRPGVQRQAAEMTSRLMS